MILRKPVTKVEFVLDYFHLIFNEHGTLTIMEPPQVELNGSVLDATHNSFRAALEALTGCRLTEAQAVEQQRMVLEFENGTKLTIPLNKDTGESVVLSKVPNLLRVW